MKKLLLFIITSAFLTTSSFGQGNDTSPNPSAHSIPADSKLVGPHTNLDLENMGYFTRCMPKTGEDIVILSVFDKDLAPFNKVQYFNRGIQKIIEGLTYEEALLAIKRQFKPNVWGDKIIEDFYIILSKRELQKLGWRGDVPNNWMVLDHQEFLNLAY